jgi:1,4-dihydroxy-6-naphthoate synthase
MNLKLGFSPCPNDTFIFDALVNKRIETKNHKFQIHMTDVEELNRMAFEAILDITKISAATYPKIADNYILIDAGSALGSKNGPILISKQKIYPDEINELKIAIPGFNTTANLLLSIAFPNAKNKKEYLFSHIEEVVLSGETDAGLIIHESRFTYKAKGLKKIVDLGEYWETKFNQLIPLGCIAVKRSLSPEIIKTINSLIKESIEYAFKHPDESTNYIKKNAQEIDNEVIRQHINLYVNQYSIELGKTGREAIRFLYEKGIELNLLPKINGAIFID